MKVVVWTFINILSCFTLKIVLFSDFGNQVASMIQLSFSVLNRLLLLRNYIKNKNPKSEVSPLEAVLFSTPGHVNQPQVVLTVAYYAFQHYNPNLAILAIQLLKRFAKVTSLFFILLLY